METLLRPYLDEEYIPESGPDSDREFTLEYVKRIREAVPEKLSVQPAEKQKVLILTDNTIGTLHSPGAAALIVMLRETARKFPDAFEFTEHYSDSSITAEMLAQYDAVVLNNQGRMGRKEVYNKLLPEYVKNGGGLFAQHGTLIAGSRDDADIEFNRLIGGYIDLSVPSGHPGSKGKPFPVIIPDPEHPLVQAFKGEVKEYKVIHRWLNKEERVKYNVAYTSAGQLCDELYVLLPAKRQEKEVEVLVKIDAPKTKMVYPEELNYLSHAITWINPYGKGRVFYTQIGHNMAVYSVDTVVQHMLDGLLYTAGIIECGKSVKVGKIDAPLNLLLAEAECVWFKGRKDKPMSAVRIADKNGNEGFWVGDEIKGMDSKKALELLAGLKGLDVTDPEKAWDELERKKLPRHFQNAVDVALWDLYGRANGKPVGELLGPAKRDKVRFYAAGFPDMTLEENVSAAKQAFTRNISGYKVYAYLKGYGPERDSSDAEAAAKYVSSDIELAKALREVVPESISLMFYNGQSYNLEQAIQVGAVLDELKYFLFFDPMQAKGGQGLADYKALNEKIKTPLAGPIYGGLEQNLSWMNEDAVDMCEIDLYAGFTPSLKLIRACEKAGKPLDLHGGFPMDIYHFPLYGFVDDKVVPWIGWHTRSPKSIPAATEFKGAVEKPKNEPWLKRIQTRPVDADGYVRIVYEISGMGVEVDWDWILKNQIE